MTEIKVISVNPSDQTLGAINTAKLENLARSLRMNESSITLPGLVSICQFIFGVSPMVGEKVSTKPAFARIVVALLFAASAFTASASFSAGIPFLAIVLIISGMMAIGFFERIAAFGGFAMLAGLIANSMIVSAEPLAVLESTQTAFFAMISCGLLVSSIKGPGAMSVDKLMSRATYRSIKTRLARYHEKRTLREAEIRLSYKAWRNSR